MRDFKTPKAGQPFKARDLADWLSETKRLGKWEVTGGTLTSDGSGMQLSLNPDGGIWAKITENGGSGKYSWREVALDTNGGSWYDPASAQEGRYDCDAAIEANFSSIVPNNTVVYLHPPVSGSILDAGTEFERIPKFYVFIFFGQQVISGSGESGSGSESGSVSGSIESGSESGSVSGSVESGSISGSVESGSVVSGSVSGSVESGSVISGSAESGSIISGSVESGSVSGSIESGSISGSVESGSISGSVESGSVESGSVVSGSFESGSISGSLESGSVSGSVESGSISGSIESGSVSGSVESGSISGAISGSEYGPVSGESGSTPCNTSGVLTIEVVTDVQCVNGSIVVTKTTIAIPGGVIC